MWIAQERYVLAQERGLSLVHSSSREFEALRRGSVAQERYLPTVVLSKLYAVCGNVIFQTGSEGVGLIIFRASNFGLLCNI